MAKAKDIRIDSMVTISPVTDNQKKAFQDYKAGKNLFLHGAAGTGKTFITLYMALEEALRNETEYDTVYVVRSAVPLVRLVSYQAMKKTRQHCSKYHIRIW